MSSSSKAGQLTPTWILIQKNKITTFYYAKDGSTSPTQLWAKISRRQGDWTGFQIWTPRFHRFQQGLKMEQAGGESNGISIQALRTLSRLWRFLPFNVRDQLAEALVLVHHIYTNNFSVFRTHQPALWEGGTRLKWMPLAWNGFLSWRGPNSAWQSLHGSQSTAVIGRNISTWGS